VQRVFFLIQPMNRDLMHIRFKISDLQENRELSRAFASEFFTVLARRGNLNEEQTVKLNNHKPLQMNDVRVEGLNSGE
jgi:hypothetical protein